ncbi:MAG: putative membrane protein [Gammaproteobacteria bacterium]
MAARDCPELCGRAVLQQTVGVTLDRVYTHAVATPDNLLVTWELCAFVSTTSELGDSWVFACPAVVGSAFVVLLISWGRRIAWPIRAFETSYLRRGPQLIALYVGVWLISSTMEVGSPAPLSFVPVLNPIELSGLLCLLVMLMPHLSNTRIEPNDPTLSRNFLIGLGALSFLWFNTVIFRATHYASGVNYDFIPLWRAPSLQSSISLAWTLLGSTLMALAALKLKHREVWMLGAVMLGFVVAKLFTVDLADIGTVARIVSFMGGWPNFIDHRLLCTDATRP